MSSQTFAQGKLEGAKEGLKSPKSSSRSTPSSVDDGPDEVSSSDWFFGKLVMYATYGAVIGIYGIENHLHNSLTAYPYQSSSPGNYSELQYVPEARSFRVDLKNHFLAGDRVYGNHLQLRLRPTRYFYIQGDYTELIEPKIGEDDVDNLSIVNVTACYDRVRLKNFNLGWLLGVRYIGSGVNEAGLVYGLQMEYFTPSNISIYTSLRSGYILERGVNEIEISARYHLSRLMLSAGYERVQLSSAGFDFVGVGMGIYL